MTQDTKHLSENIKALRKKLDMTQNDFAALLNSTQPNIVRWEKGVNDPPEHIIERMAGLFKMTVSEFRYGHADREVSVPVTGYTGSGNRIYVVDASLEDIELPIKIDNAAAIVVKGDSMLPVLKDGWVLIYSKNSQPVTDRCIGKICIVKMLDSEAIYIKEIRRGKNSQTFTLLSSNATPIEDAMIEWASPVLWIHQR